jgi:hypothetical protein
VNDSKDSEDKTTDKKIDDSVDKNEINNINDSTLSVINETLNSTDDKLKYSENSEKETTNEEIDDSVNKNELTKEESPKEESKVTDEIDLTPAVNNETFNSTNDEIKEFKSVEEVMTNQNIDSVDKNKVEVINETLNLNEEEVNDSKGSEEKTIDEKINDSIVKNEFEINNKIDSMPAVNNETLNSNEGELKDSKVFEEKTNNEFIDSVDKNEVEVKDEIVSKPAVTYETHNNDEVVPSQDIFKWMGLDGMNAIDVISDIIPDDIELVLKHFQISAHLVVFTSIIAFNWCLMKVLLSVLRSSKKETELRDISCKAQRQVYYFEAEKEKLQAEIEREREKV